MADKKSAADLVFENLEKSFGKSFICKGNDIKPKDVISTSFKELDDATGVGGIPLGIIIELFGPEASGKGVLSMHICAEAQKKGLKALWVDAENQFNKQWMEINGVNTEDLIVMQPLLQSAESILESIKQIIEAKVCNIVVVDSLASLTPQIEIDKPMGDSQVGRMGAIMSSSLRKLTPLAAMNSCTIIFINQIREKIGVMFGNPETTPGGKSLGHYSSLRLRIQKTNDKIEIEREGSKEQIGINSKVTVKKNRFGMPFKEAIIPIYFEEYNPTPLDDFIIFLRNIQAMTVRKGTYFLNKMAGESPMQVLEIVVANDGISEMLEKIDLQIKKKGIDFNKISEDTPAIVEVLDSMRSGKFLIQDFNK